MSNILILIFSIFSFWISNIIFSKWLNPLSLLTFIWFTILELFELKLLHFYPLSSFTWVIVISSFISFFMGCLIIYLWERKFNKTLAENKSVEIDPLLDFDNGKLIRNIIIVFSLIGLFGAIQHWVILLREFGSVPGVLLHAAKAYHLRLSGEIKGVLPYVWLFSFFATFFAGFYMAYKGKLSLIVLLPLLGIILKDLAKVARNGILIGMFEFFLSYFFFSFFLKKNNRSLKTKKNTLNLILIFSILVLSVSAVKLFRNPEETYVKQGSALSKVKGDIIISPHLYFYGASQIGVLNRYLEDPNENMPFASSTFSSFYNFLSGLNLIEKINWKQKPYLIPEWSNTATYLRDFYNDYGISGVLLGPFFIGILSSYFWFLFFRTGRLINLLFLVQFSVVIGLSFFVLAFRSPSISFFFIFVYPLMKLLEKYVSNKIEHSLSTSDLKTNE